MANMNAVTVEIAEGTGAGYGHPAHKYSGGKGVAICRSLKSALRIASQRAAAEVRRGWERQGIFPEQIPVFGRVTINGTEVQDW